MNKAVSGFREDPVLLARERDRCVKSLSFEVPRSEEKKNQSEKVEFDSYRLKKL